MRTIIFVLLHFFFSLTSFGQVVFQSLTTQPQFAEAGKEVVFSYNPTGSVLGNVTMLDGIVYFKNEQGIQAEDLSLSKEQNIYKGRFVVPRDAKAVLLCFQDPNNYHVAEVATEGFPIKIYKKSEVIENGYSELAMLYGEWLRLSNKSKDRDNELVIAWFEEDFRRSQKSKRKYLDAYLGALRNAGLEKNKTLIRKKLTDFEQSKNFTEDELMLLQSWYGILNDSEKKMQYTQLLHRQYPKGKYVLNEKYFLFVQETDTQKKKRIYEDFKKNFPESENLKSMQLNLAYSAFREGNWDEFEQIGQSLRLDDKASLYNSLALEAAETEVHLDKAQLFGEQMIAYAKSMLINQNDKKPAHLSEKQWQEQIKYMYFTYADTYGFVLYKQGKNEEALPYLKEASEFFMQNIEINERYAYALAKTNLSANAKKSVLEKLVREGFASSKIKEILRSVYNQEKNNKATFESYLADLEKTLKEKLKERVKKKIMKEPLPLLDWTDLEGKRVNLADYRGKVVVVNFWATWCESCVASFPSLQKLMNQLDAKEVVFLFVNTWESAENRKKALVDFLTENKYNIQSLIDKNDSVIDDFQVNTIFSRIVIGKNGTVLFKNSAPNYDSSTFIEELAMMIELAKNQD